MTQPAQPPRGGRWFTGVGCVLFLIMAALVISVAFLAARESGTAGPAGAPNWLKSWLAGPPTVAPPPPPNTPPPAPNMEQPHDPQQIYAVPSSDS